MTSRSSFRLTPPQQVYDTYTRIRNSDLIMNKVLDESSISVFQQALNDAQPRSDDESLARSLIQYLYRKNPVNFCRYLERSRLNHLILWTEAKCIVSHFGLRGVVYVKWSDDHYECSLHRNMTNTTPVSEHPSLQQTVDAVGEVSNTNSDGFQPVRGRRRPGPRGARRFGRGGRGGYDVANFPSLDSVRTPYPTSNEQTPTSTSDVDNSQETTTETAPTSTTDVGAAVTTEPVEVSP